VLLCQYLCFQQRCENLDIQEFIPEPAVTARKDDDPAADQEAITTIAGLALFSGGGGLIQTTSG
jgi:hypothetical protein